MGPTQNLKQALGFATALIKCLANILNPKPDGFPLLTSLLTPYVPYCMKGGSEIQFVADWLNINLIVTFTINPPLLNYKIRQMSYTNKAWATVYRQILNQQFSNQIS